MKLIKKRLLLADAWPISGLGQINQWQFNITPKLNDFCNWYIFFLVSLTLVSASVSGSTFQSISVLNVLVCKRYG